MGPRPDLNGLRLAAQGKIYLILDGLKSYIPNPATANNLFGKDWGVKDDLIVTEISDGPVMSDGALIGQVINVNRGFFLISNGMRRNIASPETMDKYGFSNAMFYSQPIPDVVYQAMVEGPIIT